MARAAGNIQLSCQRVRLRGVVMQQLKIILRRNEKEQALSLEINGKIYEPVDIEIAIELVKQAVRQAEEYLSSGGGRSGSN